MLGHIVGVGRSQSAYRIRRTPMTTKCCDAAVYQPRELGNAGKAESPRQFTGTADRACSAAVATHLAWATSEIDYVGCGIVGAQQAPDVPSLHAREECPDGGPHRGAVALPANWLADGPGPQAKAAEGAVGGYAGRCWSTRSEHRCGRGGCATLLAGRRACVRNHSSDVTAPHALGPRPHWGEGVFSCTGVDTLSGPAFRRARVDAPQCAGLNDTAPE
jgi:hypothetical protein